jgi:glycosyltransferase involved in cell wall biosynthesis
MNILAIPAFYGLSYPKNGGQNRFFNLIKELKMNGNKIIILESKKFITNEDREWARIYTFNDNKLFNRELPTTKDINIDFIIKMLRVIKDEKIDLIHFSHLSGISAGKLMTKFLTNKIPVVYDAHNVESIFVNDVIANNPGFSKINRILIPLYIKFLEKVVCKYFIDYMTTVSHKDRLFFIKMYGIDGKKVSVIPSGCRINNELKIDRNNLRYKTGIEPNKIVIFFHGSFHHPPNKAAFKIIMECIAPKFESSSNVLFLIGGSGLPELKHKNVKSLGFIENLNTIIPMVDIAIVPLKTGGGTKLKMFDYLSNGLPIITTKKGAEGIDIVDGEHALVVDDVDEKFIKTITYLIENGDERKRLGINAYKLAKEKYDWKKIGEELDSLYKKILDRNG